MTVAIISSCYGGYDTIGDVHEQDIDCEWIMVTDDPEPRDGWRWVYEPRPHLHPRMAAKVAKCLPHRYAPSADVTIWIDASFQVVSPSFARWCVDHLGNADIAQIRHPARQSITDEANVSATMTKYQGQRVVEQARSYITGYDFPDGWGMWATGLIARRAGYGTEMFGEQWLLEQTLWTYQDQISEPFVLWLSKPTIVDLPLDLYRNGLFFMRAHRDDQ